MTIKIAANLNPWFSKIISLLAPHQSPPMSPTPSTHHNRSSPTDSVFINSLYDHDASDYSNCRSSAFEPELADIATALASQRFFFSSPGHSNSIIDSTADCTPSSSISSLSPTITIPEDSDYKKLFNDSVAVPTYSPDPYLDFRRSMQEMVDSCPQLKDVKSNREKLQELLLCYLALNPKNTHKFIVDAFTDLLVSLVAQPKTEEVSAVCGGVVDVT